MPYTVTFTDSEGNSVSYNAETEEQANEIASEYSSCYPDSTVSISGSPSPSSPSPSPSSEYTVTFEDDEGSISYHAQTKEQAEEIAKEYAKYYGTQAKIYSPNQNVANAPDIRSIAKENVLNPKYRVIVRDKYGNDIVRTALSYHDALALAKKQSGGQIYILTPQNELEKVTDVESLKPTTSPTTSISLPSKAVNNKTVNNNILDIDGALHRAAVDNINTLAAAYAQRLIDEGKSPQEIQKALKERYGVQTDIKTLKFNTSPEAVMYKQIEKEEKAREAAKEVQNAIDETMSSISPEHSLISGLNKIGLGIESKAKQLNEAAMKNTNPVVAYAETVGAALLGAGAGVAELPEQTVEFAESAVKNPFRAVKSILLAPVTTIGEAVSDIKSGNAVDYGKIVGQTFAAGEAADAIGITPSNVIEKIPYSEKILAPAKEFAERATAKLNDVVVKPLTEYKPIRTSIIIEGEGEPSITISKYPELASLATIKDVGKIKEIKPVTAVVAETAFNLKTEPVEDFAEFRNPISEGTVKVRGEEAEGVGISKTRLKTGYELQTEKPVKSIKIVTEYANRLGKRATLASEIGEDTVKLILRKGDEIKGYGVKVVDTYPILDQESFGGWRVFGEAKEVIPEDKIEDKINHINENVARKSISENTKSEEQVYELKEETSHFKIVDVSDEVKELEKELNEEINKVFEKAVDFGKEILDVESLEITGLNAGTLENTLEKAHGRNSISDFIKDINNDIIQGQKEKGGQNEKGQKDTPNIATTPNISVTPSTTPDVTPNLATLITPDITPEPKHAKTKLKKPKQPITFIFPNGGENFYRIFDEGKFEMGRAIKVNPVIDNPLSVLFGGKNKRRRKKR